jgi:two-component system, NtrC family, response regulator PilR
LNLGGTLENPTIGLRVLVVDDEKYIREIIAELLSRQENTVVTAGDGQDALGRLQQAEFDVMLSDVRMPRMDGFELLRAVKRMYPRLAVVMMTGFSQDYNIKEAIMLGAEGYLPKPFRHDEVQLVIRQAYERARARQSNGSEPAPVAADETEAA